MPRSRMVPQEHHDQLKARKIIMIKRFLSAFYHQRMSGDEVTAIFLSHLPFFKEIDNYIKRCFTLFSNFHFMFIYNGKRQRNLITYVMYVHKKKDNSFYHTSHSTTEGNISSCQTIM